MSRVLGITLLALAGCMAAPESVATPRPEHPSDDAALSYGGLNEDIRVGGTVVRPLAVTEDSRCPVNVDCAWSGRLVLRVRVSDVRGEAVISSTDPLALPGGGRLELASISPPRVHGGEGPRPPYRFGFRRQ